MILKLDIQEKGPLARCVLLDLHSSQPVEEGEAG